VVKAEVFRFKLTPEQHETILAGAKQLDVSASEFVREIAVVAAREILTPPAESDT